MPAAIDTTIAESAVSMVSGLGVGAIAVVASYFSEAECLLTEWRLRNHMDLPFSYVCVVWAFQPHIVVGGADIVVGALRDICRLPRYFMRRL